MANLLISRRDGRIGTGGEVEAGGAREGRQPGESAAWRKK
jgi:hypothetical protein